jgi:hypothetical protein
VAVVLELLEQGGTAVARAGEQVGGLGVLGEALARRPEVGDRRVDGDGGAA